MNAGKNVAMYSVAIDNTKEPLQTRVFDPRLSGNVSKANVLRL